MMIERRFFKWKEADNNTPVRLGDNISNLLKQKIIVQSKEKNDPDYRLSINNNIWIISKNEFVSSIFFTRNSGDALLGIDPFSFKYPATKPITEFLSYKYELLPFKHLDEVKQNYKGDLLYLIFRDFNPSNIFVRRLKDNKTQ